MRFVGTSLLLFAALTATADCVAPAFTPFTIAGSKGNGPVTVSQGDINGDHLVDVAYGDAAGLHTALGKGDGTFQTPVLSTLAGAYQSQVAILDFNGDGFADILTVNGGTTTLLLGGPSGSRSQSPGVSGFDVADFSRDGHNDVVGRAGDSVGIVIGSTTGFGYTPQHPFNAFGTVSAVAGVDITGDDRIETILGFSDSTDIKIQTVDPVRLMSATWSSPYAIDTPLVRVTVGAPPVALRVVDVNQDDLKDIVSLSDTGHSFSVALNLGNYTFAAAVTTVLPQAAGTSLPHSIVAGDFNGDGHMDLVIGSDKILLYTGDGTGAFTPSSTAPGNGVYGLDAADLNGDGRLDLLAASVNGGVAALLNTCTGVPLCSLTGPPTLSVGQKEAFILNAQPPGVPNEPPLTGQFTVREGATVIGTYPINSSPRISFDTIGDHTLVATYSGDASYPSVDTPPFTVHVVSGTVEVRLLMPANPRYGSDDDVFGYMHSPFGMLTGDVHLFIDGILQPEFTITCVPAGSHVLYMRYEGSETSPPGESTPATLVIDKGTFTATPLQLTGALAGQASSLTYSLNLKKNCPAASLLSIRRDDAIVATPAVAVNATVTQSLGTAIAGTHHIRIDYPGDANLNPLTLTATEETLPSGPLALSARVVDGAVQLHWNVSSAVDIYRRNVAGAPWTLVGNSASGTYADAIPDGSAAAYLVQAAAGSSSNIDVVVRFTPTDDPVLAGVTSIRAAHLIELQTATNALRTLAGLPPMSFTEGAPAIGAFVRPSHVLELRDAINAARTALGAPVFTWYDAPVSGGFIRASHVQQLRDALQ